MKKRFRKITSILLTVVLILVVIPFGTVSSSAAETTNETVGATQKAMFIMDTVNISQGMYEGTHQGSKAIDFAGRDGGIDPAYAPFDGKVVYISTSAAYIVYQSLNPVEFADGTVDYMTVWVIHDDDVGRFYVGQTFLQGQHFFNEGSSGYATGNHIHLECAKGTYQGQYKNDYGWYCLTNQINPYDALYLSESTTIINGYGYNWRRTNSSISGNGVDLGTNFYSIIKNNYRNTVLTGVEGNNVQSYSLFGSLAQWWKFENCGNNEYKITNCHYGKCLDVYCGLSNNNTNVDLYQSNDTDSQRWLIKESSTGFVIVPKCAPSLCVDLENVSAYDGTNIQIYSCNLNDAQIYSIPFRMQSPPCDLGNSFNSTILHTGSGKALTNSDNMIRLYSRNGTYSQAWAFYKDSDCSYQIISLKGWGQCLDVNCGLPYNGTLIDLYESNDTDAQRWFIIKEGDGKYRLIPRCSSTRTLDLIYGNTSDGTGFQIYDYNQSSAQYYNIIPNSLPFEPVDYGNQFNARIINIGTNKYIIGASSKNVEISGEKASNSIWTFTKNQDGSYRITNMKYQLCLDVENGYQYEHTNIQMSNPNDTNAQKWFLVKSGNDVAFIPACAFMRSMDVKETNSTDGTNVELYTYQESQAQKFEIEFMCAIGDTNLDGNININDVTAIQRHLAELAVFNDEQLALADTNGDGKVDIADATHLQMYLAEYNVALGKT